MPDKTTIPPAVDARLGEIADKAAGQYPDPLLNALGWTRPQYVAAIHSRLRKKYRQWRDEGRLTVDDQGQIQLTDMADQEAQGG